MLISMVVAMSENGVIGRAGSLPWSLPADLKRFKEITTRHPVNVLLMGRVTYESILKRNGVTLPSRTSIVVSSSPQPTPCPQEVIWVKGINEGIDAARGLDAVELFVVGGATIYKQLIQRVDRIYLTVVHSTFAGDSYFPTVDFSSWQESDQLDFPPDAINIYRYSFSVLDRVKKKFVDPRHAKGGEYAEVISNISQQGECPFCPDTFCPEHKHPFLRETDNWRLTESSWAYDGAEHHYLVICRSHLTKLEEMKGDDWKQVGELICWLIEKEKIRGGALALRFGETELTGATVCHLHFHVISPRVLETGVKVVNFPIG